MLTILEWNNSNESFFGDFNDLATALSSSQCERIKKSSALYFLMEQGGKYCAKSISKSYRSWGEEQIARLLERSGITYQYEYPLAILDRGHVRLYYPDFRLPEYGLVIEYFGVNGNSNYDEQAQHKIEVYKQAGIDGLYLTRDFLRGDWPGKILGGIEDILKGRLERFYRH